MFKVIYVQVSLDSVVSIATHYRLDGSGFETGWRFDFLHPSRLTLRAHSASCTTGTRALVRGKAARVWH
jgi:hypothetical protein